MNLTGYSLISNHRKDHKGGGTAILIKNDIPYKRCKDLEIFIEKQTAFTEITAKNGTPIVIGSMYQTLNTL